MLSGLRVLDSSGERGAFAGHVLRHLGADVTVVSGPETEVLAGDADVLLDAGVTGLDLVELRRRHPRLVTASISPFGGEGPKAHWAATDLTIAAASGVLSLTGDEDRPPLRIGEPQAWFHAGASAACGVLIALTERRRSGLGQHVDVSAQESMMVTTQHAMLGGFVGAKPPVRIAGGTRVGPIKLRYVYPCADGHVCVVFMFGASLGRFAGRLFRWLYEEGFCDEALRDRDWTTFAGDVAEGRAEVDEMDAAADRIAAFMLTKTKEELFAAALERKLLIAPAATTADILASPQLESRRFWATEQRENHTIRVPGRIARFRGHPRSPGDPPESSAPPETSERGPALAGLKVLDFSWLLAAPLATRVLADFGATVVRVETRNHPDTLRGTNPFRSTIGDLEGSLQWHSANAGKLGISLDLRRAGARHIALDLVRWADVVVESFAPGVMGRFGLDDRAIRDVNPGVIMLSSSLLGQDGPTHTFSGLGVQGAALAGFYPVTAWPDRAPCGPYNAYSDYTSVGLTVAAVLSALYRRNATGEGQYIDFSQVEGALHFLIPALVDQQVSGRTAGGRGNDDPDCVPHGVFPDEDGRWIAVTCETDQQWHALSATMEQDDERARWTTQQRTAARSELNQAVSLWIAGRSAAQVEKLLQEAGVPADQVAGPAECAADEQLLYREHFHEVPHPMFGTTWVEAQGFRLSRTPAVVDRPGPMLGEHNTKVLEEILHVDEDRFVQLLSAGDLD